MTVVVGLTLTGCAGASSSTGASQDPTSSGVDQLPAEPRLLFEWYPSDGGPKAQYLADATGRSAVEILADAAPSSKHLHSDWSPDGTRIAFEAQDDDTGAASIWISDADGAHAIETITCQSPGCLQQALPSWSPDGRSLVFVQGDGEGDVGGPVSLVVFDLESGTRRTLVTTPDGRSAYYFPRWSPDGTRIVAQFETYPDETEKEILSSRIVILSADGSSAPIALSDPSLFAGHPDWSRTTDLIVFSSYDLASYFPYSPGDSNLYVMRSDGSDARRVTDTSLEHLQRVGSPSWTPDGKRIVATRATLFSTDDKHVNDAFIVFVDPASGKIDDTGVEGAGARLQPSGEGR